MIIYKLDTFSNISCTQFDTNNKIPSLTILSHYSLYKYSNNEELVRFSLKT